MRLSDDVLRVGGRRVGYRFSGADTRPTLLYLHATPVSQAEAGEYEPGLLEERGILPWPSTGPATAPRTVGWWLDGQAFGQPWPFEGTSGCDARHHSRLKIHPAE